MLAMLLLFNGLGIIFYHDEPALRSLVVAACLPALMPACLPACWI